MGQVSHAGYPGLAPPSKRQSLPLSTSCLTVTSASDFQSSPGVVHCGWETLAARVLRSGHSFIPCCDIFYVLRNTPWSAQQKAGGGQLLSLTGPDQSSDGALEEQLHQVQDRDRGPETGVWTAPGHQGPPGKRNRDLHTSVMETESKWCWLRKFSFTISKLAVDSHSFLSSRTALFLPTASTGHAPLASTVPSAYFVTSQLHLRLPGRPRHPCRSLHLLFFLILVGFKLYAFQFIPNITAVLK